MTHDPMPEFGRPFDLFEPAPVTAPFLFSSPHSGRVYPASFLAASRLDANTLRRSEDTFVDELFACVVPLGAPMIAARFPRAYLDVNREPYELDPRMFSGRLPAFANTRSVRVAGGLGTIARIVADTHEIYDQPLPVAAALERIEQLYKPYHRAIAAQLGEIRRRFGAAFLIDCHSMPSTAGGDERKPRPDFVLGDRYGTSCAGAFADRMQNLLQGMGYSVRRNRPYAGGYITERYGHPAGGVHAVQLEVNRGLYMDETAFEKTGRFEALRADMEEFAASLMGTPALAGQAPRDAAE